MYRYMTGALTNTRGWVVDPTHGEVEYNLPAQGGFPVVDVTADAPTYVRQDRASRFGRGRCTTS